MGGFRPKMASLALALAVQCLVGPSDLGAQTTEVEQLEQRIEELEREKAAQEDAQGKLAREQEELKRRLAALEAERAAQEAATRAIIQDALSTSDSKINAFVVFGGTFEQVAGWVEPFEGPNERVMQLNTVEFDFEVEVNDWARGSLILEYDDGSDTVLRTLENGEGIIDRIRVDTAFITFGNTQRFAPYAMFGRAIVPFGISTGDPVADVLTLEDPLTIEIFETKQDVAWVGFEFPTPPQAPRTPRKSPPPVKPKVIKPLIGTLSRAFGYRPPKVPPAERGLVIPASPPPPFNVAVYMFKGQIDDGTNPDSGFPDRRFGATVGFRSKVLEIDVDYLRTTFNSRFLATEYRAFLGQIGHVPGMAATVKMNLGPVPLIGEWNGALEDATFTDDVGRAVTMRPSAWQVSLGYQFGWNRWMDVLGSKGTYLALGYSESEDVAGVTRVILGEEVRVGYVPEKRLLASAGEWILDGVRLAVEYSHLIDYPQEKGGTGSTANAVLTMVTFEW